MHLLAPDGRRRRRLNVGRCVHGVHSFTRAASLLLHRQQAKPRHYPPSMSRHNFVGPSPMAGNNLSVCPAVSCLRAASVCVFYWCPLQPLQSPLWLPFGATSQAASHAIAVVAPGFQFWRQVFWRQKNFLRAKNFRTDDDDDEDEEENKGKVEVEDRGDDARVLIAAATTTVRPAVQ